MHCVLESLLFKSSGPTLKSYSLPQLGEQAVFLLDKHEISWILQLYPTNLILYCTPWYPRRRSVAHPEGHLFHRLYTCPTSRGPNPSRYYCSCLCVTPRYASQVCMASYGLHYFTLFSVSKPLMRKCLVHLYLTMPLSLSKLLKTSPVWCEHQTIKYVRVVKL